jgi:hypothetical protein
MGKASWLAWVIGAVVAIAAGAAVAQAHLTIVQFRDQAVARIKADQPGAKIAILGDNRFRIEVPGGEPMTSVLDRAYAVYQGNPGQLADILKGLSGSVRAQRAPAKLSSIILLVRPDEFNPRKDMLKRPLAGGMSILVAQDEPDSFEFPSRDQLRVELKLDDQAIWRQALANTRARIRIAPRRQSPGHIAHLSTGGYFASSVLADDGFWNSPELTADGPVVVAVLARDDLFLAPLSNTGMVAALRKMMAKVHDDPNGLTNDLIVRRNGRWETLR